MPTNTISIGSKVLFKLHFYIYIHTHDIGITQANSNFIFDSKLMYIQGT